MMEKMMAISFFSTIVIVLSHLQTIWALNTCCDFDSSSISCSKWYDSSNDALKWTWSKENNLPTNPDITYKDDITYNYWLQNTKSTVGASETAIRYADYKISGNDIIKIQLYRDPISSTPNQLSVQIRLPTGKTLQLFSATESGWNDYSVQCADGVCCSSYPCSIQVQIVGTINDPNNLLAFDNFVINDCLLTTIKSPDYQTTTVAPNKNAKILVTTTTTTVTITTTIIEPNYSEIPKANSTTYSTSETVVTVLT